MFLRGCTFAFLPSVGDKEDATLIQKWTSVIQSHGGRVMKQNRRACTATHWIRLDDTDKEQEEKQQPVVSVDWLKACVDAGRLLDVPVEEAVVPDQSNKAAPKRSGRRNIPKATSDNKTKDDQDENDVEKNQSKASKSSDKDDKTDASLNPSPEQRVTEIRKGAAAVDRFCEVAARTHVYSEGASDVYDAMLNQTNIAQNNNKFYIIQLLQSDHGGQFFVWRRWGRVGAVGQRDLEDYGANLAAAKASFKRKFMDKTKNAWDERADFQHVHGKYDLLQRDYGEQDDDDEEKEEAGPSSKKQKQEKQPDSKLPKRVQSLLSLIFDVNMMNKQMVEIGYDARRMPLGKLTKDHIMRGYDVLKQISEELSRSSPRGGELSRLSSRFYTIIPHDFGRVVPPVINTRQKLKEKLEMIDALVDIQIATNIIKQEHDRLAIENPLDSYYHSLNNEIKPIVQNSAEWRLLEKYVKNTHAATHSSYTLDVLDIYEVNRQGELQKFQNKVETVPELKQNRMLLWHGSRLSNYVGILSQGLRIAPPEAPVTGYMFGKGVYFADMVSKSANYCCTSRQSSTGLLVLCEVALGKPIEYTTSDYNAHMPVKRGEGHSTKGCGTTATLQDEWEVLEDGLIVPCGRPARQSGINTSSLLYNEYIVYDTSQIRMRYLVQVKFNYK